MAKLKTSLSGQALIQSNPKKTKQGQSKNTSYSATSNSTRKKKYRGQGK